MRRSEGMDSENGRAQTSSRKIPYHSVFVFLTMLLIGILEVYADGKKNVFETHLAHMHIFVFSAVLYCFVFVADLKYQHYRTSYSKLLGLVAIILGSLSAASVTSILFGNLVFVAWGIVTIIVAYGHSTAIKKSYNGVKEYIKQNNFRIWDKGEERTLREEASESPV